MISQVRIILRLKLIRDQKVIYHDPMIYVGKIIRGLCRHHADELRRMQGEHWLPLAQPPAGSPVSAKVGMHGHSIVKTSAWWPTALHRGARLLQLTDRPLLLARLLQPAGMAAVGIRLARLL